MRDRILETALGFTIFVVLLYAAMASDRAEIVAESNLTLSKLLEEQVAINREKLTSLELALEAMYTLPPRVADSLRLAILK